MAVFNDKDYSFTLINFCHYNFGVPSAVYGACGCHSSRGLRQEKRKKKEDCEPLLYSGVPRNFVRGGGGSTNSVEDRGQREQGSGGGSPLVRDFGGSCNLVQEVSYSKIFLIFGTS